ncbi:site-specific integrase [Mycobacterium sherrisii]|uniref:site-specific integrase n=1 Tax=Mycobacterium sherrisii TaxID=243061 RepID=UPI002DDD4C1B|nr:site-specific integrase [Mycobacterium sherrisii]MEC4765136.1 site-specific integrase [Mycobacterium sherrisii]
MAGRPPLRIGQHGKIAREYLGGGVWVARCKVRDADGVTRRIERRGPADEHDKHGKLAEDALIEALLTRRAPGEADQIALDTKITVLIEQHLARLAEDGRSPVTLSTYRFAAAKLAKFVGSVRVSEATPARIDAAIRSMRTAHGPTMARQAKTILRGGLQLAVMANTLSANPVRDVQPIGLKRRPKGATALSADELRDLLVRLRADDYCQRNDLVDPITVLIATGLRRSELLALRWTDFDETKATIAVTGKVVRVAGVGLQRIDDMKTDAGRRTIPLPDFAVIALQDRRAHPYFGESTVIFPSTAGTLRDPNNLGKQWRKVRDALGVPGITTHSFRKTVATLIDEEGLSARVGADHLGHSKVSMTQDRYMSRGRLHTEVAALLDRAIKYE